MNSRPPPFAHVCEPAGQRLDRLVVEGIEDLAGLLQDLAANVLMSQPGVSGGPWAALILRIAIPGHLRHEPTRQTANVLRPNLCRWHRIAWV